LNKHRHSFSVINEILENVEGDQ